MVRKMTTIVWNEINLRKQEKNLPQRNSRCLLLVEGGSVERAYFNGLSFTAPGMQLKAKTGIALDKRKIVIADPIKNVGTYTVTCKLGYEISAPLTVKIVEA